MKLVIQLVTWNSAAWLPFLFVSLKEQTLWQTLPKDEWKLLIWDNASEDNTVFELERLAEHIPHDVFSSVTNVGFAVGHNALFRKHNAEYTLLLNPDIFLLPTTLETLFHAMQQADQTVSGITPRLMRGHPRLGNVNSDVVDSLGFTVQRSRRVIDVGAGESWTILATTYHTPTSHVFGVSGALPLFRTAALKDIAFQNGDLFAAYFHSYKEDVDVAFRLVSRGYTSLLQRDAIAYHARGSQDALGYGVSLALAKEKDSTWTRELSYRNHWYLLIHNEYAENGWRDFPFIAWYELTKLGWHVLRMPRIVWRTMRAITMQWSLLKQHREEIIRKRRLSARDMRQWWVS